MSFEPVVASIIAAVASIGVALISKFYGSVSSRRPTVTLANERAIAVNEQADPLDPALQRLQEARDMLRRQRSIAQSNRWISASLIIGQYIIGGLLASSFVQESLKPHTVGLLGLLVLVSSLLFQHFRPDIRLRGALARSLNLKNLIRVGENEIHAIRTNQPQAPTAYELGKRISDELSRIEASELNDAPVSTLPKTNDATTT